MRFWCLHRCYLVSLGNAKFRSFKTSIEWDELVIKLTTLSLPFLRVFICFEVMAVFGWLFFARKTDCARIHPPLCIQETMYPITTQANIKTVLFFSFFLGDFSFWSIKCVLFTFPFFKYWVAFAFKIF